MRGGLTAYISAASLFSTPYMFNDPPPTTSLNALDEPYTNFPSQSWVKPFEKLLVLLGIVDDLESNTDSNAGFSNVKAGIENHYFCFEHNHDLSEFSRVFLWVHPSSGDDYKLDIDDIQFCHADIKSGSRCVAKLREYATCVLSKVRVSGFIRTAAG